MQTLRRVWQERVLFRRSTFHKLLDVTPLIETERDLLDNDVLLLALNVLLVWPMSCNVCWRGDGPFVSDKTLSINTVIYI